ncbi:MAG: 3-methyl-2-oxobutanoate dehydrogenase subunit VorB [Bacteroidales bacterium]|nr:3-methyl-2-oxobutanoate dehydrogenase subunit VorB [Bacteroidales bacterium]
MMGELRLMKGNEALAEAAIRAGVDGYFGYPITPQSEVIEYLMAEKPFDRTGMIVLQAESEVASINMLYGGGGTGKKVMTSSSSPGISLMQEGLSYMAGAEIPCVVANVVRGGPGLGDIQPAQSDYFQSVKGGGHGDYRLPVLAPASVQEMSDFVPLSFDLAFKYRTPVLIVADGLIGQMMEKVELFDPVPRLTDEEVIERYPWATNGKPKGQERRILTSLHLDPYKLEKHNMLLQEKYRKLEAEEVRFEMIDCETADYIIIAYGSSARIAQKSIQLAGEEGIKVGLLRPISLWPFPKQPIDDLVKKGVKGFLAVEMSAGQMVEDVRLTVRERTKVEHFGRYGGVIHSPEEVLEALKNQLIGG